MNKDKSMHDRVFAVLAGQKVEELKARHAYLHSMGMGREEYGMFWLRSDNSTFGHTFGRMMGWKELVPAHFGKQLSINMFGGDALDTGMSMPEGGLPFGRIRTKEVPDDRPTTAEGIFGKLNLYGHDEQSVFAQGCHVLGSPVIEIADDLKSARSFYLTPGTMTGVNGDKGGRTGGWLWERYGSEFVYRDGRWWWFHEQVCPDLAGDMDDENWAQDRFRKYLDGSLNVGNASAPPKGGISDLRSVHNDISITQTVQDTVPAPEPYAKLDEEHTYSPGCTEFEDVYIYPPTQGYGDPIY